jgi:kynureninase
MSIQQQLLDEAGVGSPLASAAFAHSLDERDPLKSFRSQFHLPPADADNGSAVYLCGNSLGCQPKATEKLVMEVRVPACQLAEPTCRPISAR